MSQFEPDMIGPERNASDAELDALFAAARAPNETDAGAAERFLAGHRARLAQTQATQVQAIAAPAPRPLWVNRTLVTALASAAVIAGISVLRPTLMPADLPASAAYAVYQDALGEGW
ncbi:hypothetical protein E7T06_14230 [Deinococcus sp. Arct2-2]|uniref:hypothetical protein n=1 Tax=Deinococcus sp. Arct2-2 TaxID=2568653 RepID=UPI0010A508B3|nr:hypothetical protein [Deinococcus sp. Arct2-2]THF68927.1 hypothetical protein E7T06_14230 [Deinococcus sp. Arct2-2]